ncbi:MAG: ankyrin repeat domain-containing protein [Roseimicrobium sp.]
MRRLSCILFASLVLLAVMVTGWSFFKFNHRPDAEELFYWLSPEYMRVERNWVPSREQVLSEFQRLSDVDYYSALQDASILTAASFNGDEAVVRILLARGANPNPARGRVPLISASVTGNVRVIECLIEYGSNVNARNDDGTTALHNAVFFRKKDVVRQLIQAGASCSIEDRNGQTPMDIANKRGDKDIEAEIRSAAMKEQGKSNSK